jgi:hypothetical protein
MCINPGAPQTWAHVTFPLPQFKNTLKSKQFEDVEMIKLNSMQQLLKIPRTEYERCFQQ